ncbi:LPS assembly lipoprotein LptE [Lacisediminimonas sp.]|uniref:LPS-assembly lipoprotein LptE n=1 Tax=Lacisediminimonas sp. TaxID=3060582 RepID=UPI002716F35F|nr:LPS assembly lipoprotein LptE [Lacisediminimonas sp.]MDO8300319.1 LPS assembly lipoprotein LptE [Lacisediminimonas sp.]
MRLKIGTSILILATSLLLAACGFQLRGSGASAMLPFNTMYIDPTGVGIDLKRRLARSDATTLVNDRKAAEAIVEIISEVRERLVLSLNSQGRVREYTLNYRVNFRIKDNTGRELRPDSQVVVQRTLSFNESQVLAKEGEEATLYRDMQSDMVGQLLRRIAATRPWNPPQQLPAPSPALAPAARQ